MQHSKRFRRALALGLGLALALAPGCKPSETPPAPTAPAAAPAPVQVPFAVKGISLGNSIGADKRVAIPASVFAKSDTIYASVATEGASPSVTLAARWTYEGDQLVSESSETIAPTGPAVTEFHVAKPDGWPAGKYRVEVSANGAAAGSQEFSVAE